MENATKNAITLIDKEHSHLQQNTLFQQSPLLAMHFLPVMNKSLCAALIKICTCGSEPQLQQLKHTTHLLTVLTSTAWSPQMFNKHWWMPVGTIFSTWRNSISPLWFTWTSTSETTVSDCPSLPSVAHHQNGILEGRFNLYCHPTNIHLWHSEPTE